MTAEPIKVAPFKKETLIVDSQVFRSALDFKLTKKDFELAFDELGETEDLREKCLKILKEMLNGEPGLKSRLDDDFLLRYLRFRKFDCDRAFATIQNFYRTRHKRPDLFALPPTLKSFLDKNIIRWLPYLTEEGCVVFLLDFGHWNLEEMSLYDVFLLNNALSDVIIANQAQQVQGTIGIWNTRGFSARHAAHCFHPQKLQFLSTVLQNLYPWRIKKIIGLNCNAFIYSGFKAISFFLSKKMKERFVFLGSDLSELHQHVSPEILPKEYGGKIEDNDCNITEIVMQNLPYLKFERSFGYINKEI